MIWLKLTVYCMVCIAGQMIVCEVIARLAYLMFCLVQPLRAVGALLCYLMICCVLLGPVLGVDLVFGPFASCPKFRGAAFMCALGCPWVVFVFWYPRHKNYWYQSSHNSL